MSRTITNHANLPRPMYRALAADTYVGGGDISATRIIAPPRIVALRKYHEDEIVEDASDRVWSLLGSSVHRMLELSASDEVVEARLSTKVKGIKLEEGEWVWEVTGQPDLYDQKHKALYDYKVTSVWSVLFGDKPEWDRQLNIQAMLHRLKGDEVSEAYIVAILRDWQMRRSKFEKDYPATAVHKIAIPLWPQAQVVDYVQARVKLHQKVQKDYEDSDFDPDILPLCTPEERWLSGNVVAVKRMDKSGKINKKADRLFPTEAEAKQFQVENKDVLKGKTWAPLEHRMGENKRCLDYCDVNRFCPFYQSLVKQAEAAALGRDSSEALVNETDEASD